MTEKIQPYLSIGDVESLQREAQDLLKHLDATHRESGLPGALAVAEDAIARDVLIPLLSLMQGIERDASQDFIPVIKTDEDQLRAMAADIALVILGEFYDVTTAQADVFGWGPVAVGGDQWSIMYQHTSGQESNNPEWPGQTWQQRLMLQLPLLMAPHSRVNMNSGSIGNNVKHRVRRPQKKRDATGAAVGVAGDVAWSVTVRAFNRGEPGVNNHFLQQTKSTKHKNNKSKSRNTKGKAKLPSKTNTGVYIYKGRHSLFSYYTRKGLGITCPPAIGDDLNHYCVLDVVKTDSEGDTDVIRELVRGPYKGLHHATDSAWDTDTRMGVALEDWVSVSLTGLVLPALMRLPSTHSPTKRSSFLIYGMGGNVVQAFISTHVPSVDIFMVENSANLIEHISNWFPIPALAEDVTTTVVNADPVQYCTTAVTESTQRHNTIVVHMNGPESILSSRYRSAKFVNGLLRQLNTDEGSILAIHVGGTEDVQSSALSRNVVQNLTETLTSEFKALFSESLCRIDVYTEEKLRDTEDGVECTDESSIKLSPTEDGEFIQEGSSYIVTLRVGKVPVLSVQGWCEGVGIPVSGAMDFSLAQNTDAVRVPNFLTRDEIQSIHKAAEEARKRGAGVEVRSKGSWHVVYLQTYGLFPQVLPGLKERILLQAKAISAQQGWNLFDKDSDDMYGVRVAEYHHMGKHGALPDPKHYDLDSLVTVDIMLTTQGVDYDGGCLQTEESDKSIVRPLFEAGDAVVFVSHKPHHVTPVTKGVRHVLVVEIWKGRDSQCAHRCEAFGTNICAKDSTSRAYSHVRAARQTTSTFSNLKTNCKVLPFRLGSVQTPISSQQTQTSDSKATPTKETTKESYLLWEPYEEKSHAGGTGYEVVTLASSSTSTTPTNATHAQYPVVGVAANDDAWDLFD
eukprot:CFRG0910T1